MPHTLTDIVKANDVRGLVGSQLDERVARAFGTAFARCAAGAGTGEPGAGGAPVGRSAPAGRSAPVVVGHDMRESSPLLVRAFAEGASAEGVDVELIGLTSTDGLYYASGALDAPAVMFTASHNPAGWNGMKLCSAGARPIGLDSGLARIRDVAQRILDGLDDTQTGIGLRRPGRITERDTLTGYASHLRGLVDLSGIRPLRIVVDAGNGMAGLTTPAVLGTAAGLPALPLDVIGMYLDLDGTFPNHEANPLDPANLRDLQARVPAEGADLGLAFDGDADRCFVVDERGEPVSPSAVTALVAGREIDKEHAAGREPTVIHNLITSRVVPEVVREHGGTARRTRVGHAFIKVVMAETGAVFGGEHSAHYYFRDFWYADTGMLAAMHLLAALGSQPRPLSELVAPYQRYVASGEINSVVDDVAAATERVERAFAGRAGVALDRLDGLTVSHEAAGEGGEGMWWFNLRPSNTEPLLRLNAEADESATMQRLRDQVLQIVRG